jgi:hypothetical protein
MADQKKRIKAPKTFKELMKKCYNSNLSINEKYMDKIQLCNEIDSLDGNDDFWRNSFDAETMKEVLWVEKDYNKEVSGRDDFWPFFYYHEDDVEGFMIYYYRKKAKKIPKNKWKEATKCWAYRIPYDLLCRYVRENVYPEEKIEEKVKKKDDIIHSRAEILEL